MWVHLYDQAGVWIGQFANADVCTRYVADQGWDINDYKLEIGPSKYASS